MFGMGTGVSPERIITGNILLKIYTFKTEYNPLTSHLMLTNLRPNTVGVRDDLYQVRLVVFSVGKETTSFHKIFLLGQALDLLVLVS